jgi:hypothetical protein
MERVSEKIEEMGSCNHSSNLATSVIVSYSCRTGCSPCERHCALRSHADTCVVDFTVAPIYICRTDVSAGCEKTHSAPQNFNGLHV